MFTVRKCDYLMQEGSNKGSINNFNSLPSILEAIALSLVKPLYSFEAGAVITLKLIVVRYL